MGFLMSIEFIDANMALQSNNSENECADYYRKMSDEYKQFVSESVFVSYFSSKIKTNILWHDYEAGGTESKVVQPLQFAAMRTTVDHQLIDIPIDWYCKLHGDKLPHPYAIQLTKISPKKCMEEGLPEPLFFKLIESEMSVQGTCVTGQNSMGYDENITRFGLWRNLLPVYEREFKNGNSRWDILNVLASFSMFNVDGIKWPLKEDGTRSLKLELFSLENGITQENAHNALDDVKALVDVSRLLKSCSVELWNYLFDTRFKRNISWFAKKNAILLHSSVYSGSSSNFLTPILIVGSVPGDKNKLVYIELNKAKELRACWKNTPEQIKELLFSSSEEVEKDVSRPPLGVIALNKSPALFQLDYVNSHAPELWSEDYSNLAEKIIGLEDFKEKLCSVFEHSEKNVEVPAEEALYDSGFPSKQDEQNILSMKKRPITEAFSEELSWSNPVYSLLWKRAQAKLHGYDGFNVEQKSLVLWDEHRKSSIQLKRDSSKHDSVSWGTVMDEIKSVDMDLSLEKDYRSWLLDLGLELGFIDKEVGS